MQSFHENGSARKNLPLVSNSQDEHSMREVRRRNFLLLLQDLERSSGVSFGQGLIYVAAKKLKVTPAYVSFLKTGRKGIGEATRFKIEKAFSKPAGWLNAYRDEWDPADPAEALFVAQMLTLWRSIDNVKALRDAKLELQKLVKRGKP